MLLALTKSVENRIAEADARNILILCFGHVAAYEAAELFAHLRRETNSTKPVSCRLT